MRKTQINGRATGSYKMMPFLGLRAQACKKDSYSEKNRNQTSGQNIPPYKMRGCCKEMVDAHSPTFCMENCLPEPIHFVVFFCKTPRFIATNSGV